MDMVLKRETKIAGLLLLAAWLVFAACNFGKALLDPETFTKDNVLLKYPMIEAYGLLQKAMGKRELNSFDLVKDRLGYLHTGNFYVSFGEDQRKIAINYRRLSDFCGEFGTKTGVIVTPMKVAPEAARYPGIPYNSCLPEADTLLAWLRYYGVSCLDLTGLPEESGLGYEGSFYKTDHHWTTPAAFYGYRRILSWLEELQSASLYRGDETRKPGSYTVETDILFGSQGRRAGLLYSGGPEPFSVYYPRRNGSFTLRTEGYGGVKEYTGGFRGGLTNEGFGKTVRENLYGESSYDLCFLHGLHDLARIENLDNPDGLRVLLLCDSYATPLGCFLAQNVSRLDMVYNLGSQRKNALTMIQENQYDYVIACLYPENLALRNCRLFEDLDYA